jgi:hypothetical protein
MIVAEGDVLSAIVLKCGQRTRLWTEGAGRASVINKIANTTRRPQRLSSFTTLTYPRITCVILSITRYHRFLSVVAIYHSYICMNLAARVPSPAKLT